MDYFNTWESLRTPNEVIETMVALTSTKKMNTPYRFSHKRLNIYETEYSVWFSNGRYSYEPPAIKGTIKVTANGCRISAEPRYTLSRLNNVMCLIMNMFFFVVGIAMFFADFKQSALPATMFILLTAIITFKYLHARKKYQSPEHVYEMINTAAGVDYKRNAK